MQAQHLNMQQRGLPVETKAFEDKEGEEFELYYKMV
jgi:hypothetical protein